MRYLGIRRSLRGAGDRLGGRRRLCRLADSHCLSASRCPGGTGLAEAATAYKLGGRGSGLPGPGDYGTDHRPVEISMVFGISMFSLRATSVMSQMFFQNNFALFRRAAQCAPPRRAAWVRPYKTTIDSTAWKATLEVISKPISDVNLNHPREVKVANNHPPFLKGGRGD